MWKEGVNCAWQTARPVHRIPTSHSPLLLKFIHIPSTCYKSFRWRKSKQIFLTDSAAFLRSRGKACFLFGRVPHSHFLSLDGSSFSFGWFTYCPDSIPFVVLSEFHSINFDNIHPSILRCGTPRPPAELRHWGGGGVAKRLRARRRLDAKWWRQAGK